MGDFFTIEQIKIGYDNFTYIIHCPIQKKAAIVDPSVDASKTIQFLTSHNLTLNYILITHYHTDHTLECKHLKTLYPSSQLIASEHDGKHLTIKPDHIVSDNDTLTIGTITLKILLTPGHTPGSICILINNQAILTGDTLFIDDCGRTDLPEGNLQQMYTTLHKKIIPLPNRLIIYPGHDYGHQPSDTLGHQKHTNKTLLAKNLHEFSQIP